MRPDLQAPARPRAWRAAVVSAAALVLGGCCLPATSDGAVGGFGLAPLEALGARSANGDALALAINDFADSCAHLTKVGNGDLGRPGARHLNLALRRIDGRPLSAGTYAVRRRTVAPPAGQDATASAFFYALDEACQPQLEPGDGEASDGEIELVSLTAEEVRGRFWLTFGSRGSFSGTFLTQPCPGLFNTPNATRFTTCER